MTAALVYPHQLFADGPLLAPGRPVYLIEEPLLLSQYRFHVQKRILHRASLRAYADRLRAAGHEVRYVEHARIARTEDIATVLEADGVTAAVAYEPIDDWLETRLSAALAERGIALELLESPMFLTDRAACRAYAARARGRLRMRDFYAWQRRRLGVLVDEDGAPAGGRWSFDTENRKRIPADHPVPPDPAPSANPYVAEARDYVVRAFPDAYGTADAFFYPVTHEEAATWLSAFLAEKLRDFGPYEDAITTRGAVLYHSVLSPLLNVGLLTPRQVLDATLAHAERASVPLPSLEGFVRQVIGWREFVRLSYLVQGRAQRSRNALRATRPLPESFWTGTTGIEPIDHTVLSVLRHAYAHHIPRLMVMGSFMTLAGIRPDDAYRWFMELFIDAYDWVMVPNVYGMALYADGGLITTKPYVASSAYLRRMADYPRGDWEAAWDALFWRFVGAHEAAFAQSGRLGFVRIQYKKMSAEKRAAYATRAEAFLASLG